MAKGKIHKVSSGLTPEQYEQLIRVTKDPFFFALFIYLIHPKRGKVKFDLYPFQKAVLWEFLNNRFTIILKFRQAGVTELISMYCLWLAMYHPNKSIVIISLKDRVAKKVLRKIKYMYKNLPEHLKVEIINGRTNDLGTSTEIEFANGSTIASIPTTEDAGRSEGLSLLVIDEAAIIKWAGVIWAASFPTLSTGGASIVNSTPYGVGNWYHQIWVEACARGNEFRAIRLRWQMHPERDMKWYNEMKAALGPRKTAQEIDGDFLTSGASVFDLVDIRAIEDELESFMNRLENPEFDIEEHGNSTFIKFKDPIPGEQYFIGADVATGRSRDYSAFSIMNRAGEEYACFKGKIGVDKFAELLMKKGKKYNTALIAPESNDIGLATVVTMQAQRYPNIYYATKMVTKKGKKKKETELIPGWYTTKANRPVIIDGLETDIRNDAVLIKDVFFVQEAYTFIYDESNRPIALGKNARSGSDDDDASDTNYTDDTILAKCITNHIRKGKTKSNINVAPI